MTTPGQTTNQGLSGALTSNIHLIVNANNIAGILVAMANSLFNSLIQASVSALNGALNNAGLNSAGANNGAAGQINTLTGTAAGNSPPPQAVACSPTTEALPISLASTTQGSAYFGATGGANDANGLPPTYTWTALGGNPVPVTQTGIQFSPTYSIFLPGTYTYNVQVTASTGGTATCQIQITAR